MCKPHNPGTSVSWTDRHTDRHAA